ncbi:hypothetical protein EDB19DRAFT_1830013 [Suillus lakei]|nr:hypothetical protein EDB19DRAFT_1830013 [Suillus lakei]
MHETKEEERKAAEERLEEEAWEHSKLIQSQWVDGGDRQIYHNRLRILESKHSWTWITGHSRRSTRMYQQYLSGLPVYAHPDRSIKEGDITGLYFGELQNVFVTSRLSQ